MILVSLIFWCLIFGVITAAIAQKKNLGQAGQWFFVGALLGIIGVLIVVLQPSLLPKAPPGMVAVKCARCNAVQNIPQAQPEYQCWQCKAIQRLRTPAPSAQPLSAPRAPNPPKPLPSGKSTKARCHHCQHVQVVPEQQRTFVCEECGTKLKRLERSAKPAI